MKILIFLFLSFQTFSAFPQQGSLNTPREQNSIYIRAKDYYNRAVSADAAGKTDSIAWYIRKSLELSLGNSFTEITADNYRLLGLAYDRIPDWENTLRNLLRAGSGYNLSDLLFQEAGVWDIIANRYYSFEVFRKAKQYSLRSYNLYSSDWLSQKAASAEMAGKASFRLSDYKSSVIWFDTAYSWYAKQADTPGMVRSLQGSASSYIKILDTSIPLSRLITSNLDIPTSLTSRIVGSLSGSLAIKRYEALIPIHEAQKDNSALAGVYNNIGYVYFRQDSYKKAGEYFTNAIEYLKLTDNDDEAMASTLTNLAICYQNTGEEEKALSTFYKALDSARKRNAISEMARIDHILSKIFLKENDFYHSELYCLDCIKDSRASGDYQVLQQCYQTFSEVKEKGNDFIKALEYFQRHLELRDSLAVAEELAAGDRERRIQYYEDLEQKLLLEISDEDLRFLTIRKLRADSLTMQSELRALRSDSLGKQSEIMALRATADLKASEQQRLRQALDLEVERNRSEQQQRDIQALEQEKTITELTLKAQEDEQERLLQALDLEKARRITAIVLVVLAIIIALTILVFLIYTRSKNKKLAESKRHIEEINLDLEKKNAEISEQKEVIEQKNKAITDSIQYASRIQTAVLPSTTFMNEWGIDNFILFMPKDIVSGDFFWGVRKKGKMIIAAADCTGHGVPGAFMSMLGNAFLNEIVNACEEPDAATVLNSLRDEVIKALRQKGVTGEARDGMDIALCIIDPVTMKGTFAGANNPMYLVRNGELTKIPADRMPIGIHLVAERPFTGQPLELRKGDAIYLATDGYADQFGGPAGKKFMYKPLQELFVSIAKEPVEKQHDILRKTFIDWQGEYEQVDDVLVMGFKV